MAINKEKLAEIINGKARELCSESGNRLIDKKRNNNFDPDPNSYSDYEIYDRMYLSEASNNNIENYNIESIENSKLPKHIKESLKTQKINMPETNNISVLDELGISTIQPKKINENIIKHTPQNVNPQIDYTIIKAIVNECLKEYFDKKTINESASLQTIGLQNGNISLVDNKGNIYKAKLEKIGNKNGN